MERSESSCAKWARQLSLNQIREIVMDSDSDEEQYDASGTEDEEMEPRPPSQKSHLSQAVSSSDSSARMTMLLRMWQVNSHNPCSGHCPLTPECVYCTHLPGPPKGKAVRQHMSLRSPLH